MGNQIMVDNVLNEMVINSVLKNRTVPIIEEFDRESCYKVKYWIEKLVRLDDRENIPMKTRKPIKIEISSYGGCAYSLLSLIGVVESLKERGYIIHTHLNSIAMSSGFYLLMCGNKRSANRHSTGLIHSVQTYVPYSPIEGAKQELAHTEFLQNKIEALTLKYTKFTEKELEEIRKYKLDKYMSAEELLEKGVIDEII